jgi:hypothetical protein
MNMKNEEKDRRMKIRLLNDQFRMQGLGRGSLMHTSSVHQCGPAFVQAAINAVRSFDGFNNDNDPYGEHDFGAFEVEGEKLFFKIDYYDLAREAHPPDAADPAVTHRVLTIMLAEDY